MRAAALFGDVYRDLRGAETSPGTDDDHLEAAIEWIYRAQDATASDGCAATYNLVLGWEPAYPETTGYIVPTLYDYAAYADAPEARERAERMADWLLGVQLDDGAFPAGTVGDADPDPSVFNTGQILFGLARAYEETGDEAYLRALSDASTWLASVQEPEGYWSKYAYKETVHAYTARVGWALAVAAGVTGDATVREAARRNLEWVRTTQRDNGTFRHCAFEEGDDPYLHTIAYTIRGLVEGGYLLDDQAAFAAGQRTADRLLDRQDVDGHLAGAYDDDWNGASFDCLTGTAQTAIVWFRLAELRDDPAYVDGARRAVSRLKRAQRLDGPSGVAGGLAGSRPVWGSYMWLRYPNWAPKFFADALLASIRERRDDRPDRSRITERNPHQ